MSLKVVRQLGGASIELAFITVGVAVFITGAADLTRIFQARGAVQAAVHEGLRCLYSADQGCAGSGYPATPPSGPLTFDVWVGRNSTETAVEREYVTASASWDTEPLWRVPIEESAIKSVLVERDRSAYSRYRVVYPVEAHALYVLQTSGLPRIGGSDPLNPIFSDDTTGEPLKPTKTVSLRGVRGEAQVKVAQNDNDDLYYAKDLQIGEVSFSLREAWQGSEKLDRLSSDLRKHNKRLRCYSGPDRRASASTTERLGSNPNRECFYNRGDNPKLISGGVLRVPLMLRISGSSIGTHARPEKPGKIVALMTWSSPTMGRSTRRLGGRLLSLGSSGDFVTRGVDWREIEDNVERHYRSAGYQREIEQHNDLGLVPLDATITVKFFLSSSDGMTSAWQGRELELFFPTFRGIRERASCGFSGDPSVCEDRPPFRSDISYSALDTMRSPRADIFGRSLCSVKPPAHTEQSPGVVIDRLKRMANPPANYQFWSLASDPSGCSPVRNRYACPAALTSRSMRGCEAQAISRDVILRECGVPVPINDTESVLVERSNPTVAGYENVRGCSDQPLPTCAAAYREEVGSLFMQKGLSCAAKSTKSTPPEKIGPVVKDSCAPFPYASFEAEYRARNGVPAEALVELVRASAPDMLISDKQETGCVIARDVVVREESQCGSRVGSEEVRACCSAAGGDCRYQQSEPSNRGVELHNPSANTSPAISRAVSLVQAVFPGAEHRKECLGGEAYCLQVDAKPPGNGERARLSASINVPMSLLGFVGSEVIKVSFEAAREGELSRVRRFD